MATKAAKELLDLLGSFNTLVDGAEATDPVKVKDSAKDLISKFKELTDGDADLGGELKGKFDNIINRFKDDKDPAEFMKDLLAAKADIGDSVETLKQLAGVAEATIENMGEAIDKAANIIDKLEEHGKVMAETFKAEDKEWHDYVKATWEESRDKDGHEDGFGTFLKHFFKKSGETVKDDIKAVGRFFHGVFGHDKEDLVKFAHGILEAHNKGSEEAAATEPAATTTEHKDEL